MVKFNRNYDFRIQTRDGSTLALGLPFTLEFDISRNILTSANVSQIRIYNLSEKNRNQLRFDYSNYGELRPLELAAGYGRNIPTIFKGTVSQCWSFREGVNFITQVESFDSGFAYVNGRFDGQFIKNSDQRSILENMVDNGLPGVEKGVISPSIEGKISRGNTYSGNTVDLISQLVPGQFFIDNGKANILGDDEALEGDLTVISADSGLLGTPILEETILRFEIIFEPRLIIGQIIRLESITNQALNGVYQVISIKHRGIISESVAGTAITEVGLFKGAQSLKVVGNG